MQQIFVYESNDEIAKKLIIKGENYHYLVNVLRFKEKDHIKVVLNEKNACIYEIENIYKNKRQITLNIIEIFKKTNVKQKYKTINIVSSLKKQKNELVIQKCCELNTNSIIFFNAQNSIKKITEYDKFEKRYQKVAYEASKQCKRTTIANIKCLNHLNSFLENTKDKKLILVLDEIEKFKRYNFNDIKILLKDFCLVLTITGPEGGFSDKERQYFISLHENKNIDLYFINLGTNILRAETATIFIQSLLYFNQNF